MREGGNLLQKASTICKPDSFKKRSQFFFPIRKKDEREGKSITTALSCSDFLALVFKDPILRPVMLVICLYCREQAGKHVCDTE